MFITYPDKQIRFPRCIKVEHPFIKPSNFKHLRNLPATCPGFSVNGVSALVIGCSFTGDADRVFGEKGAAAWAFFNAKSSYIKRCKIKCIFKYTYM